MARGGHRPRPRGKPLQQMVLEELKEAGENGVSYDELLLEFKEYKPNSVSAVISQLSDVHNIKKVPYRRSGFGNLVFKYTLLPQKKIEIK